MFIFVTGGYRSGRSNYALRRAAELGPPPWLYVTAGEEETAEAVRQRIERHRRDKEAIWQTAMAPADLGSILRPEQMDRYGAVVLDGFIGWLTTRTASLEPSGDEGLLAELEGLADRFYRSRVPILLVSQEIGLGLPPGEPRDRRFLRLATSANQILAGQASHVVMMVSGLPLKVR